MANVKNYVHPHISSSIIDNSEITTLATSAATIAGPILYTPIVASRGKDSVHQLFTDAGAFIAEYGEPNFKKYGQTMYNALRWLISGGQVRAIRVVATDATAAAISLKVDVEAGDEGKGTTTVTIDGTNTDALFTVKCKGKGAYGNNYSIGIANNDAFASTYDFPLYTVTVYEKTSIGTKVVEGPYLVSLKPDSVTKAGKPLFIKSVFETYSTNFEIDFNEDVYYGLLEDIDVILGDGSEVNAETVDFICGDDIIKATIPAEAVALIGGSDGSVGEKVLWKDVKNTYETLFEGAYCIGTEIDASILEKRNYPIDVLLDASFPVSVKNAVQKFQEMRGDCFAFLAVDPENAGTYKDTMDWVDAYVADALSDTDDTIVRNYSTALYGQSFVCADTYSGGDIEVDFCYILASMIPTHDLAYGAYVPMAGSRRGVITGFKKLSFNPNDEQQDALYRAKVNYAMQTTAGTRINSNLTLQDKNSALSNINNVRTCYSIIRAVENMSDKYEFEFADTDTFNAFQNELNSTLAMYSSAVKSLVGTVYQTDYDKEQKIARIRLEVVFKDILERIIIELNVGR